MRLFKAEMVDAFLRRFNVPDDQPIEASMVTKAIASAQTQREAQNFEIRKDVLKYDDVLNRQRGVVYDERQRVLAGEDISGEVHQFMQETIRAYVVNATGEGYAEDWDLDQLWTALKQLSPLEATVDEMIDAAGGGDVTVLSTDFLSEELLVDAREAYEQREEELGAEAMREFERKVVLSVLDRKWREHLHEVDHLRHGIGLRAMAQRDPLVEYQREGYDLFNGMMDAIREETVGYLFNAQVEVEEADEEEAVELPSGLVDATASAAFATQGASGSPEISAKCLGPQRPQNMQLTAPSIDGAGGAVTRTADADTELESESELDPNASRAERRRVQRSRSKKGKKRR